MLLSSHAPVSVALEDGTPLRLRPIAESDGERLQQAYRALSPESRLNRFWEVRDLLSEEQLSEFTDIHNPNHFSWIALYEEGDDLPGFGAASCWLDPSDEHRAEISFTVVDAAQSKGIGTLLLSILWFEAWQRGIREFYGVARRSNAVVSDWLVSLGAEVETNSRHFEFSLPLVSPEYYVAGVQYGGVLTSRRIILADWMQGWLSLTGD